MELTSVGYLRKSIRNMTGSSLSLTNRRMIACPVREDAATLINVASYKSGVCYAAWTHIDGWSDAVVEYVRGLEQMAAE